MSAISLIKILPGDGNKNNGTSCEVTKSKPKSEIISLRVPNRHREIKESPSSIPYFYYVIKQKRKKKRRKITVLTVPNLEETMEVENYEEELVSVPTVHRLSLEELKKWRVKERKQNQKVESQNR